MDSHARKSGRIFLPWTWRRRKMDFIPVPLSIFEGPMFSEISYKTCCDECKLRQSIVTDISSMTVGTTFPTKPLLVYLEDGHVSPQ